MEAEGDDKGNEMLLALATGLRETGWAVFEDRDVVGSGVAGLKSRWRVTRQELIDRQLAALTDVAERWGISRAACSSGGAVNLRRHEAHRLEEAVSQWAEGAGITLHGYPAREVRAALTGNPNASGDAMCFAVMRRLGLIGQSHATAEWEAIAVGCHHLGRRRGEG